MPVDFKNNNFIQAWNRFRQLGYTPLQTSGMIGRLVNESGSGLHTGSVGDSGISHNIGQWNGQRWTDFQNFVKSTGQDPNNVTTGVNFIDWELKNKETTAANLLKNAKTPEDAAKAGMAYERPKGWSLNDPSSGSAYDNTVKDTNNIFSKLGSASILGGLPSSVPAASGTIGSSFLSPGVSGVSGSSSPDTQSSTTSTPSGGAASSTTPSGPLASSDSPLVDKNSSDLLQRAMQGNQGGSLISGTPTVAPPQSGAGMGGGLAAQMMARFMPGGQTPLAAPVLPAQSYLQGYRPSPFAFGNIGAPGLLSGGLV